MYNMASKFFSQEFQAKVIRHIKKARLLFQKDMAIRVGKDMEFGSRFFSDDDVWQAFVSGHKLLRKPGWSEGKLRAQVFGIEDETRVKDPDFQARVWEALAEAAKTDYHYLHEKEWE